MILRFLPLVLEASLLCWKFRLLLWLRPVATLNHTPAPPAGTRSPVTPADISRAVSFAARFIPAATCLPQALTAEQMLLRHGIPCKRQIGVTLTNGFAAHAWVSASGLIVHGKSTISYSTLQPR